MSERPRSEQGKPRGSSGSRKSLLERERNVPGSCQGRAIVRYATAYIYDKHTCLVQHTVSAVNTWGSTSARPKVRAAGDRITYRIVKGSSQQISKSDPFRYMTLNSIGHSIKDCGWRWCIPWFWLVQRSSNLTRISEDRKMNCH